MKSGKQQCTHTHHTDQSLRLQKVGLGLVEFCDRENRKQRWNLQLAAHRGLGASLRNSPLANPPGSVCHTSHVSPELRTALKGAAWLSRDGSWQLRRSRPDRSASAEGSCRHGRAERNSVSNGCRPPSPSDSLTVNRGGRLLYASI